MNKAIFRGKISKEDLTPSANWQLEENPECFVLKALRSEITIKKTLTYPEFFAESRPKGGFLFGYREPGLDITGKLSLDDEYLIGEIDPGRQRFSLEADALLTLPLYWTMKDSVFYFSSDLMELLTASWHSGKFNLPVLAESILLKGRYNQQTIFKDVFVLTDREQLEWNGLEAKSKLPPPRQALKKEEVDDRMAVAEFGRLLEGAAKRKLTLLQQTKIGAELSGGLDSSTVAYALIKAGAKLPLPVFSQLLPSPQRENQLKRVQEFADKFNCRLITIELENLYPLANLNWPLDLKGPFDPTLEPYRLGVSEEARLACAQLVKALFTGMGGDELFENVRSQDTGFQGELEWEIRQKWLLPDYLTDKTRDIFLDRNYVFEPQPIPFFTHSILAAHQVRNQFFVEQGVWPVSLLADSSLVTFCRRLPLRFAKKKTLLRLYQETENFPESFYGSEEKDSMYPLYEKAIKHEKRDLLFQLFRESRLAQMGLVDKIRLLKAYREYLAVPGRDRGNFYEIAVLELFLRSFEVYEQRETTA